MSQSRKRERLEGVVVVKSLPPQGLSELKPTRVLRSASVRPTKKLAASSGINLARSVRPENKPNVIAHSRKSRSEVPAPERQRGQHEFGATRKFQCDVGSRTPTFVKASRLREAEGELNYLKGRLQDLQDELRRERVAHKRARKELERKSSALLAATVLLGKGNLSSSGDVVGSVTCLNDHILQLAAQMTKGAEACAWSQSRTRVEKRRAEIAQEALTSGPKGFIGLYLLDILSTTTSSKKGGHLRPQVLAHYAIQAWMTELCFNYLETRWSGDEEEEKVLRTVYGKFRAGVNDDISELAGQWRRITHTVCRATEPPRIPLSVEEVQGSLRNILFAFGGGKAGGTIKSPANAEMRIRRIFDTLTCIGNALREGLVTADVHPVLVAPGQSFACDIMEDELRYSSATGNDIVLAPITLGLKEAQYEKGNVNEVVILKPRVIVGSLLRDAGVLC